MRREYEVMRPSFVNGAYVVGGRVFVDIPENAPVPEHLRLVEGDEPTEEQHLDRQAKEQDAYQDQMDEINEKNQAEHNERHAQAEPDEPAEEPAEEPREAQQDDDDKPADPADPANPEPDKPADLPA